MINIIEKYKNWRNLRLLNHVVEGQYAFVGVGNHSMSNLYPVLDYLHVPLKYICCKSAGKLSHVEKKWKYVQATTSLEDILRDKEVKGVFVSVTPSSHFEIARKVLASGKALFIEKPPCSSLDELRRLMDMERSHVVIGMQKRYAPCTRILKRRLKGETLISYNMKYLTGSCPECDVLTELFIHPIDYVCYLFGEAEVCACEYIQGRNGVTLLLILEHEDITGVLELSTAYSWQSAVETLTINTEGGTYELNQMESLMFTPKQGHVFGVPLEKVLRRNIITENLFSRNNFVPMVVNNQIYTQGYWDEIKAFVDAVEKGNRSNRPCGFGSMYDTYRLMSAINKCINDEDECHSAGLVYSFPLS